MPMRIVLKLAVAAAIVASTYYAIVRIAEEKAEALAGGETFALDGSHPAERDALEALSRTLRGWGEHELASSLEELQASGRLRVAPRLAGGRGSRGQRGFAKLPAASRAPIAQLDRASGCGPEGRMFESCWARQISP